MDKALFEKNLASMERYQPDLAARIAALENVASRLVPSSEGDDFNIDLGHVNFYEEGARAYSQKQAKAFFESPDRIQLGWVSEIPNPISMSQRLVTETNAYFVERGITAPPQMVDPESEFAIVLGLGLGYHIGEILDNAPVRSVIIAEQFLEFVHHAMHLQDFAKWYDDAKEKNGFFGILVLDDPDHMANVIYYYIKRVDFGIIDGSYFYSHYDSFVMNTVRERLLERLPVMAGNPGFFEDEVVMMRNCFDNITGYDAAYYVDKTRSSKNTPMVIVGSGPSVDSSIDFIRRMRDRVVLFSCGTGLGTLLNYGVTPDFHAELENTPGPAEIIAGIAEKHDLSGITLIATNTVHPDVPAHFGSRIFFFRDTVTGSRFFGRHHGEIYNAAPTVTNTGTRIALGLGFTEIYLVGVDFGARDKIAHHSGKSVYDEEFLRTHPEHKRATNYPLTVKGNFGGEVHTNHSFLNASVFFSGLPGLYKSAKIYNCSDGMRIHGTIPKLPETVDVTTRPDEREWDMRSIQEEFGDSAGRLPVNPAELEELQRAMKGFYADLRQVISEFDENEADIFQLYDRLKPVVYTSETTPVAQTVHQFHVGTVMMAFQMGYQVLRRLKQDQRKDFVIFYKGKYLDLVDEIEGKADALMDYLLEKARAA